MAAAYVAGSRGTANGSATTLAVVPGTLTSGGAAQATTSGNVLLAFFSAFNSINAAVDITGCTATGATFTEDETLAMNGIARWQLSAFYAENITGQATHTLTGAFDSSSFANAACIEVSGVPTSATLNADASATGTSTDPTGAAISPTANGLHVFFVAHDNLNAFTAGAGWTEVHQETPDGSIRMGVYTRAAVSGVSQTPAVTHATSAAWAILHLVIAETGGGGAVIQAIAPRWIGRR